MTTAAPAAAASGETAGQPRYPFPDLPAPGERIEVAPGVWWLRMPLPFALDHINLWLLESPTGWTIVDTGIASPEVKAAWETLLAGLDKPVERIVVTHFHPDHLGLAAWLMGRTGAPLAMTAGEFLTAHAVWHQAAGHGTDDMVGFFRLHGLDDERCAKLAARGAVYPKGVPALPQRYERLIDGDRIAVGDTEWQVVTGYGHAPEHAALFSCKHDVLISGDMVLPRITTNVSVFAVTPDADSLSRYLDSVARYGALGDDPLVLPSHGRPFYGLADRVAALAEHHDERLADVEAACAEPQSAGDLLPVLFKRELDSHQVMFAMSEAIAHLNYLEHARRLRREAGGDGVIRFRRP